VVGRQINQRGDLETVEVQTVVAGTEPDKDSYLIVSSSVDAVDSIKSKRKKVVVNQYSDLNSNGFQMGGGVGAAGGAKTKITNVIADPSTYQTPTPDLSTLAYQEKRISKTKLQVVKETLDDPDGFPKLKSSEIDPVSHTGVFSSFTQITETGKEASASGGLVKEYADIDKWHSQLTQKDYSSLVGLTWIEYENESYAPPARLYVAEIFWGSRNWNLGNIISYQRPQPKTVTATVTYTIKNEPTTKDCFNPITQTLITDLGTFTNVIHNVQDYKANGNVVSAEQSLPTSTNLPEKITYRFSSTRIPRMGGLYLEKVVTIPFYQLYINKITI
jgi:hypothetical protein